MKQTKIKHKKELKQERNSIETKIECNCRENKYETSPSKETERERTESQKSRIKIYLRFTSCNRRLDLGPPSILNLMGPKNFNYGPMNKN